MSRPIRLCSAFFCASLLLVSAGGAQTLFTDVTEQVGLQVFPGDHARNIVFVDYNNDGLLDVCITENRPARRIGLFRNTGDGRFVDQTFLIPSDLHVEDGGAGAIFGDYDNDGDEDLFLPVWPHNVLLRNDRGVFVRVEQPGDLGGTVGTDSAVWLDYDRDGYLDLYVTNMIYVALTENPAVSQTLTTSDWTVDGPDGVPHSGDELSIRINELLDHPNGERPWTNRLLRNQGDGTFADRTTAAGLEIVFEPHWGGNTGGLAAGDFNNDGWPDLYLGVEKAANRLFINDGQGGFQDATTDEIGDAGEAFSIAIGDINNDGDLDIFQGAEGRGAQDRSLMLLNLGEGQFLDVTEGVGLGVLGTDTSGTGFADIDNDGDVDLVIGQSTKESGRENFLFLNDGTGVFIDATASSGIEDFGGYLAWGESGTEPPRNYR